MCVNNQTRMRKGTLSDIYIESRGESQARKLGKSYAGDHDFPANQDEKANLKPMEYQKNRSGENFLEKVRDEVRAELQKRQKPAALPEMRKPSCLPGVDIVTGEKTEICYL